MVTRKKFCLDYKEILQTTVNARRMLLCKKNPVARLQTIIHFNFNKPTMEILVIKFV